MPTTPPQAHATSRRDGSASSGIFIALSSAIRAGEQWLARHTALVVLAVIGAGLAVRAYYAQASYLNPDEALHVILSRAHRARTVYRHSLPEAHPPLAYLVEYLLGPVRSEIVLRLPSMVAGTAALWLAYKWLVRWATPAIALWGVVLLAFSPGMISGATEVRAYGLLQLGVCGALYYLDRLCTDGSSRSALGFAAFLYIAILSNYGALWVVIALGVFAPIRLWQTRAPAPVIAVWVISQFGAAALYAALYVTHLVHLHGSGLEAGVHSGYLHALYFQPDQETAVGFLWTRFVQTFRFLMGKQTRGNLAVAAYLVGVAALVLRSLRRGQHDAYVRVLQLLLPFVLGGIGAILQWLPFGGSRHVTYVLPFAAAGAAAGFGVIFQSRWMVIAISAIAVPLWLATTTPDNDPRCFDRTQMTAAVNYIQRSVSPGSLLVTDGQTSSILLHYLDNRPVSSTQARPSSKRQLGTYRLRVADTAIWHFEEEALQRDVARTAQANGMQPGESVWVVGARWEFGKPALGSLLPPNAIVTQRQFACLTVLQMKIASDAVSSSTASQAAAR